MRSTVLPFLATLLMPALSVSGQELRRGPDANVYRVEFNIRDGSDAAARNGRRYALMVTPDQKGTFHVGQKVPYATGSLMPAGRAVSEAPITQFNYADIGVNIQCQVSPLGGQARLKATLDLSSVIQHDKAGPGMPSQPVIGQLRTDIDGVLNLGRATTVASIDDPVTSRKVEIEATITKLE